MGQSAGAFIEDLLACGRRTFTRKEAGAALGSSPEATYLALHRLARRGRVAMPRRGFYLIVEPQHRAVGAPPPASWIGDLMRFLEARYYVGLLSAAALHGAAHQQPQELQVVAGKVLRPVVVGRARIRFFFRGDMRAAATQETKTAGGTLRVSTPETTAYDLVRYRDAASIDHVATVISELAERMGAERLGAVVRRHREVPVVQRLGYLLDHAGRSDLAAPLERFARSARLKTVPLEPGSAERVLRRDGKWRVDVNAVVEVEA
jgi:predicted transcriptional regulator of viral defense system